MIGAIAGDMIGKPYERYPIKHKDFDPLVHGFTDDTVLAVATVIGVASSQHQHIDRNGKVVLLTPEKMPIWPFLWAKTAGSNKTTVPIYKGAQP